MTDEAKPEDQAEEKPRAKVDLGGKPVMRPTINWDKLKPEGHKWRKIESKPIGKTKTV